MKLKIDSLYFKLRPVNAFFRVASELVFEGRQMPARWMWANYFSASLLKLSILLPQLKKIYNPIFIIGMGRSGTTILSKVLSLHPDISLLDEPKLLWHIAYPLEDLAGNYSKDNAYYELGENDANGQISQAMHRMYGFYLTCTRSTRILDKYPELIFRVPFVRSIFPDAKFVFIIRNGANTIRSVENWSQQYGFKANNGDIYDWWGVNNRKWRLLVEQLVFPDPIFNNCYENVANFESQRDKAAVEWILTMRQGLRLIEKIPQNIYSLHYEDLINHPERELNQIIDYCKLSYDIKLITYALNKLTEMPYNPQLEIHPSIRSLFEETMCSVGYQQPNY